jgi:hypothetical protein
MHTHYGIWKFCVILFSKKHVPKNKKQNTSQPSYNYLYLVSTLCANEERETEKLKMQISKKRN